jgi:hypothetical protein
MKDDKPVKPVRTAYKKATLIGGVTLGLAAVGLLAVILLVGTGITRLFDNTKTTEKLEKLIKPVVMMDPVPFARAENISDDLLLSSSLWSVLLGEDSERFGFDELGMLLVPSSDIDLAAAALFGPSIRVAHRSFEDQDASYLYDPEIDAYRIPIVGKVAYSPSIREITKTDSGLVLRVGYIAPGNVWSGLAKKAGKDRPIPDKYMIYNMNKWDRGYYIASVVDVDENRS